MTDVGRLERELARLGAEHEPPAGWEDRVTAAIAGERIEGELARLGDDHEPPPGWQARVLAATAERPKRRWWWLAIPAFAVAAVIVYFLIVPPSASPPAGPLAIAITTERTDPSVHLRGGRPGLLAPEHGKRSSSAPIGDTLHAKASAGAAHRAVWVYRGERELVAVCPGTAGCREEGNALVADVVLGVPGTYNIVILGSSSPLPAPTGSYDHDVAEAARAGATYLEHELEVR